MPLPKGRRKKIAITLDHAALTATGAIKMYKAPRRCEVEKVDYINPTGLAGDPANFFELRIKNGSTVVAGPRSTENDNGGTTIAADTFIDIDLSATLANRVLAEGDVLLFDVVEGGTATLPAGRVIVHLKFL